MAPSDNNDDRETAAALPASVQGRAADMARPEKGLLPTGLSDLLAPHAAMDAQAMDAVLSCFAHFGYQRIKPPLLEFEQSLLADGPGAKLADQTFRLLDPISRRMMGLRADMTAQIARISGTRLADQARPLRLAYGGEVMRVVPDVLNPERQLVQAGAEIIGRDDEGAVTEIILVGMRALKQAGLEGLTIDLGCPHLAELVAGDELSCMDAGLKSQLIEAIANRDLSALSGLPVAAAGQLASILEASGASPQSLRALCGGLPAHAGGRLSAYLDVAEALAGLIPDAALTLDPLDMQGLGYHTTLSFSVFAGSVRGAVARGGAYRTGYDEAAVGLSVYMERVLRGLSAPEPAPVIYIPAALGFAVGLGFVGRGRHIIYGTSAADTDKEARALGCSFIVRASDSPPEPL